jgi:hypothetical protein
MQTILCPGFIRTAGSESNSCIRRSSAGRDGADGTSLSTPHIVITAETGEDDTNSAPFTGPSAECVTDDAAEAVPESFRGQDTMVMAALSLGETPTAAGAADRIPDSADEEETEAIGEKLRRGDNDEQDKRRPR